MAEDTTLTKEQIERIRNWLDRRCLLGVEMAALCDLALRGIEDRRDAERYQWLRANHNHEVNQLLCDCDAEPTNIDAAIDRAMAEGREGEMTDKTRHADDATLAYIAQLEKELAAANARLAGIVEEVHVVFDGPPSANPPRFVEVETPDGKSISWGRWEQRGEYWHLIGPSVAALAPVVAEKVNAEAHKQKHDLLGQPIIGAAAPIPQPADGVVVPNREQLLSMAESCGIHFSRYAKGYLFASVEELERLVALLAAAQEPRK